MDIKAPLTANVWKVLVAPGHSAKEGDTLVILEAMKMEIPIEAPCDGKVEKVLVTEGGKVSEGDLVVTLKP
jgi:pyruvate carboxylase subunit B